MLPSVFKQTSASTIRSISGRNHFNLTACGLPLSLSTLNSCRYLHKPKTCSRMRWATLSGRDFHPRYTKRLVAHPKFDRKNIPEPFHYSSFEMVDEIASYGIPSILAGMVRLSSFSLNQIEKACGRNLRVLYRNDTKKRAIFTEKKSRDFHYSDAEIRAYYERIQAKCLQKGIQFTTCYIGNGEGHFWKDQDLWSNKSDCCNAIGRVEGFRNAKTARDIAWDVRIKHTSNKCLKPENWDTLHAPLEKTITVKDGKVGLVVDTIHAP